MERADKIGLGVASAGHVLLFGLLSTSWLGTPDPLNLRPKPIEVTIADEVALQSTAPKLAVEPPPAPEGEIEGPPEEAAPAPSESVARPEPTPAPPAPAPKPQPRKPDPPKKLAKPEAEKKPAARKEAKAADTSEGKSARSRGSRLKLDTTKWASADSKATRAESGTPAASIGPAQKSALDAEIRRQLKPHWKAPTGADAELLRTVVDVRLARDGSVVGNPEVVDTVGTNDSNRAQVRLHQEQAVKAIRLAAPFRLPADLYSGWSFLRLTFDRRLSQ